MNALNLSKVLVGIDGSDMSLKAAAYGIDLAKKNNSQLTIIYVIHIHASSLMYTTDSAFKQFIEKNKSEAETWFDTIRNNAKDKGIEIKTEIIEELYSVAGAIINYAEKNNADAIIIGGTGRSGFKRLMLGSVAADVVRYSKCPVFVIK